MTTGDGRRRLLAGTALVATLCGACGESSTGPSGGGMSPAAPLKTFVTSAAFTGDIRSAGGQATAIASADSLCMADANRPAGGGAYRALLVDGADRVACTTALCSGGTGEHADWVLKPDTLYFRDDGTTPVLRTDQNGIWDFGAGGGANLMLNSFAAAPSTYWTGLDHSWTSVASPRCGGWANGTGSVLGGYGASDREDAFAIGGGVTPCSYPRHLLCIEQ